MAIRTMPQQRRVFQPRKHEPIRILSPDPIPASEQIYYRGESDEDSDNTRRRKRVQREKFANQYLEHGYVPIMTAGLLGPFDGNWKNPWLKRRRTDGSRILKTVLRKDSFDDVFPSIERDDEDPEIVEVKDESPELDLLSEWNPKIIDTISDDRVPPTPSAQKRKRSLERITNATAASPSISTPTKKRKLMGRSFEEDFGDRFGVTSPTSIKASSTITAAHLVIDETIISPAVSTLSKLKDEPNLSIDEPKTIPMKQKYDDRHARKSSSPELVGHEHFHKAVSPMTSNSDAAKGGVANESRTNLPDDANLEPFNPDSNVTTSTPSNDKTSLNVSTNPDVDDQIQDPDSKLHYNQDDHPPYAPYKGPGVPGHPTAVVNAEGFEDDILPVWPHFSEWPNGMLRWEHYTSDGELVSGDARPLAVSQQIESSRFLLWDDGIIEANKDGRIRGFSDDELDQIEYWLDVGFQRSQQRAWDMRQEDSPQMSFLRTEVQYQLKKLIQSIQKEIQMRKNEENADVQLEELPAKADTSVDPAKLASIPRRVVPTLVSTASVVHPGSDNHSSAGWLDRIVRGETSFLSAFEGDSQDHEQSKQSIVGNQSFPTSSNRKISRERLKSGINSNLIAFEQSPVDNGVIKSTTDGFKNCKIPQSTQEEEWKSSREIIDRARDYEPLNAMDGSKSTEIEPETEPLVARHDPVMPMVVSSRKISFSNGAITDEPRVIEEKSTISNQGSRNATGNTISQLEKTVGQPLPTKIDTSQANATEQHKTPDIRFEPFPSAGRPSLALTQAMLSQSHEEPKIDNRDLPSEVKYGRGHISMLLNGDGHESPKSDLQIEPNSIVFERSEDHNAIPLDSTIGGGDSATLEHPIISKNNTESCEAEFMQPNNMLVNDIVHELATEEKSDDSEFAVVRSDQAAQHATPEGDVTSVREDAQSERREGEMLTMSREKEQLSQAYFKGLENVNMAVHQKVASISQQSASFAQHSKSAIPEVFDLTGSDEDEPAAAGPNSNNVRSSQSSTGSSRMASRPNLIGSSVGNLATELPPLRWANTAVDTFDDGVEALRFMNTPSNNYMSQYPSNFGRRMNAPNGVTAKSSPHVPTVARPRTYIRRSQTMMPTASFPTPSKSQILLSQSLTSQGYRAQSSSPREIAFPATQRPISAVRGGTGGFKNLAAISKAPQIAHPSTPWNDHMSAIFHRSSPLPIANKNRQDSPRMEHFISSTAPESRPGPDPLALGRSMSGESRENDSSSNKPSRRTAESYLGDAQKPVAVITDEEEMEALEDATTFLSAWTGEKSSFLK